MTQPTIRYVPRQPGEPLAQHLYRNADSLRLTRQQRERLRRAAVLSRGGAVERADADVIAASVRAEVGPDLADAILAAGARGERVAEVRGDDGVVLAARRVVDRDGLWLLIDSGSLTERQANTALVYRHLFETSAHAAVGSQLGNAGHGTSVRTTTDGMIVAGLNRAAVGLKLAEADQLIAEPHRLNVLRGVAGEGRTIRSLYTGGRSRELATQRLAEDLDKVRVVFADLGGLRIVGH